MPLESGITANGLIDWGVLGPENTAVTQPGPTRTNVNDYRAIIVA